MFSTGHILKLNKNVIKIALTSYEMRDCFRDFAWLFFTIIVPHSMSKGTNKESLTVAFMCIPLEILDVRMDPNSIYHLAISNLLVDHSGIRAPSEPVFICPPKVG